MTLQQLTQSLMSLDPSLRVIMVGERDEGCEVMAVLQNRARLEVPSWADEFARP